MRGVAPDFGGEGRGIGIPAKQEGSPAKSDEEVAAGDDGVDDGAPNVKEADDTAEGDDDEQAGDRWIEFEDERNAEVGEEPESGSLKDGVERLIAAQKEAGIVEAELGEGADQESDADEKEW